MSHGRITADHTPESLTEGFDLIRGELKLPAAFPDEVETNARAAATSVPDDSGRLDMRDIRFVTIDPPGSLDLDQAVCIDADGDDRVIRYAIADVGAFVPRGGPVDREAWDRGETIYLPDARTPLYPTVLSEGAASLLPDQDRPAIVFTIAVAADGELGEASVTPALVRSTRRMTYAEVDDDSVPHLRDTGERLLAASARRGASQVDLPDLEVEPDPGSAAGYRLVARERLPAEDWNAQVSLAANMVAARMMVAARTGLFRVMAAPDPQRMADLAAAARALGFDVAEEAHPGALVRAPGPPDARRALGDAARATAGAGYRPFDADTPPFHAAVAAAYSHATAPLRRLADRYVLDLLVALSQGREGEETPWGDLARTMDEADNRAARAEAAAIDLVEAFLLAPRVGQRFDAVVTGARDDGVRLQLVDPPVRAALKLADAPAAGTHLEVTLTDADVKARRVRFAPAG